MGLPKTGTTSFQATCKANTSKLLAQGFVYPNIAKKENEDMQSFFQNFIKEISSCLSSEKNMIISAESISSLNKEGLKTLKDFFISYNFEIIPIILVRSPYELICSAFQQRIKAGLAQDDTFFPKTSDRIQNIKEVFENVQIFAYNTVCKHEHGLIHFLFEKMNVDSKDFEIKHANKGLSNTITRIQKSLNAKNPAMLNGAVKPNFISVKDLDSKDFTQKFLLTEEEFAKLKIEFEDEQRYFIENLGEEFIDKEIQFTKEEPVVSLCNAIIKVL